MSARITKWVMLVAAVVVLGWDVYVTVNDVKGDTISELLRTWAWKWPTIPFVCGVVLGHLFWNVDRLINKWRKIYVLWGVCASILAVDILWVENVAPVLPAVLGVVIGHWLWPQPKSS